MFEVKDDGNNVQLFDEVKLKGSTTETQVLWPTHCVKGSKGWEFHKDLEIDDDAIVVEKGFNELVDSYSGFFNEEGHKDVGDVLRENQIEDVYVCGLAYDFCVGSTALDATQEHFNTYLLKDATRWVGEDTMKVMDGKLLDANVTLIGFDDVADE
eukprot:m.112078 g.112078  ORF g.112078 m.112078 type:complete len:155 (+) comp12776_c3_seq13:1088-1552(+)